MLTNKMAKGLYNGFDAGAPAAHTGVDNNNAAIAAKYFPNDLLSKNIFHSLVSVEGSHPSLLFSFYQHETPRSALP